MKKFRKIIGGIGIMAMLACLTACGSSNEGQETDGRSETPEAIVSQQEETNEGLDAGTAEQTGGQDSDVEEPADTEETGEENARVLVAYFSATGTTKALAEYAADAMGADLYEIVPEEPYTNDDLNYSDRSTRATVEQNDKNARPAISGSVENMAQYEIVFLAFPIWWGEEPRIMDTFVESYDFSGKTVIPFCTSGGSGIGSSGRNMQGLSTGDATWLDGARLSSSSSREDMVDWLNSLGLDMEAK
ncbi:MAG: flavodoxin [Bacteroides sp.]|nr:flavodoxin [Bacteroides sp.]MCM1550078.1 flavodoxin [Clostridium sp.]